MSASSSNRTPLGQRQTTSGQHLNLYPASLPPRANLPASGKHSNLGQVPKDLPNSPFTNDQGKCFLLIQGRSQLRVHPNLTKGPLDHTSHTDSSGPTTSPPNLPSREKQISATTDYPLDSKENEETNNGKVFSKNDVRSDPSYRASNNEISNTDDDIAYTSPWTGIQMTHKELGEYEVGKEEILPNGKVEVTYFKPSFVEEGLWDRWEKKGQATR